MQSARLANTSKQGRQNVLLKDTTADGSRNWTHNFRPTTRTTDLQPLHALMGCIGFIPIYGLSFFFLLLSPNFLLVYSVYRSSLFLFHLYSPFVYGPAWILTKTKWLLYLLVLRLSVFLDKRWSSQLFTIKNQQNHCNDSSKIVNTPKRICLKLSVW